MKQRLVSELVFDDVGQHVTVLGTAIKGVLTGVMFSAWYGNKREVMLVLGDGKDFGEDYTCDVHHTDTIVIGSYEEIML